MSFKSELVQSSSRPVTVALGLVHIARTGGTAIRSGLSNRDGVYVSPVYFHETMMPGGRVDTLPEAVRSQFTTQNELAELCSQNDLVMGHHGAQALIDAGCGVLATEVREPRSRLLSLYRYWQALPDAAIHSWGWWGTDALLTARLDLAGYLSSSVCWTAIDNAMARQLLTSGNSKTGTGARVRTARSLKQKDRYGRLISRLSIAEWSNDSQRFMDRVSEAIGQPTRQLRRENGTDVKEDRQTIDARCLSLLDKRTELDRRLIERLMSDGVIPTRSKEDLDNDFEISAKRLHFDLA